MDSLYQKHYLHLFHFVSGKIADPDTANQIANDSLLAAIDSYSTFRHQSAEFSWICSIANHKIIDYYRKKKLKTVLFSHLPFFEDLAVSALTPERDTLKNELFTEVRNTLDELTAGYRQILRLKYLEGLKIKQIASLLDLTTKAVESRLIRAKAKFRLLWIYDHPPSTKTVSSHHSDSHPPDRSVG